MHHEVMYTIRYTKYTDHIDEDFQIAYLVPDLQRQEGKWKYTNNIN